MVETPELYCSQKRQDRWVDRVLRQKEGGYFVEVGAADGILHSNTLFFERQRSWNGLLIEPVEEFYHKLVKNRSVTCINAIVNDAADQVLFRPDRRQGSGIVANDTDNNYNVRQAELAQAQFEERNARTLTSVLDEAEAPSVIDYLSLDVEGAEARVLRGVDFSRYIFGLLTVERADKTCNDILKRNGYHFVQSKQYDNYYIHDSYLQLYPIKTTSEWVDVDRKEW